MRLAGLLFAVVLVATRAAHGVTLLDETEAILERRIGGSRLVEQGHAVRRPGGDEHDSEEEAREPHQR